MRSSRSYSARPGSMRYAARSDDHLARVGADCDSLRVGRDADATVDAPELALAPRHRVELRGLRALGGRKRLVERVDPSEQRAELEAPEDLLELRPVRRLQHESRGIGAE